MSACQNCRGKKKRCDAKERVPCSRCERLGLPCVVKVKRARLANSASEPLEHAQGVVHRSLTSASAVISLPPSHPFRSQIVMVLAFFANMFNDRELMEHAFIVAGALRVNLEDYKYLGKTVSEKPSCVILHSPSSVFHFHNVAVGIQTPVENRIYYEMSLTSHLSTYISPGVQKFPPLAWMDHEFLLREIYACLKQTKSRFQSIVTFQSLMGIKSAMQFLNTQCNDSNPRTVYVDVSFKDMEEPYTMFFTACSGNTLALECIPSRNHVTPEDFKVISEFDA